MTNFETIQDHVIHHSANLAAIAIPVMSVTLHAPEWFAYATGAAGLLWYAILITERACYWAKRLVQWHRGTK